MLRLGKHWRYALRAMISYLMLIGKVHAMSPAEQQRLATIGLWGLVGSLLVIAGGGILNALASRRRRYRSPGGPRAVKRKKRSKLPRISYRNLHKRKRPKR